MRRLLILILTLASQSISGQPFTTYYPTVTSTNTNTCRISKVVVDENYTYVSILVDAQKKGEPWVSFSQHTILVPYTAELPVNDFRKIDLNIPELLSTDPTYLSIWRKVAEERREMRNGFPTHAFIIDLGNNKLDTKYDIKSKVDGQKFEFVLRFNSLTRGVEEIVIMELIENGFEWIGVKINNPPHTSPTTDWNELSLKSNWDQMGIDPFEGIYESTGASEKEPKYRLAVKKRGEDYDFIYLSGADNSFWKAGDIKAHVSRTASPNLFTTEWYMGNKELNKDVYTSFEPTSLKTIWPDSKEVLYIKLYPTSTANFGAGGTVAHSGTGFALSADGYIATNAHVVQGARQIRVRGIKGDFAKTYDAEIVVEDKNNDLAIIRINDSKFTTLGTPPFKLDNTISDVGSTVYALGYPLRATMGDEVKLTNGIISSKSGFQGDITSYQLSIPIQPGNSGGPLLNSKGNIIGVINAKHSGAENVSYGVKVTYLTNLIQSMNQRVALPAVNIISSKTLPEQVKQVRQFVFIIETN